jgi:hypothetical protein
MSEMLDTFGVPEFYSDHVGAIEDAGSGMIRIVRCIERGGVLIPVFSCIVPALTVLKDAPRFRDVAMRVTMEMASAH